MKISPQDILTQEFTVKFKGFDKDEVKNFLFAISDVMESVIHEKEEFKKEILALRKDVKKYEKREEFLRDTLVSAQKFSKDIKNNAEREVELIIKEAEIKADEIVNHAIRRQKDLSSEIRNLKFKRNEIEGDIVKMLDSLKDVVESYRQEDDAFEKVEFLG